MSKMNPTSISEIVDHHPLSRFQMGVLFLCFLVAGMDGFDTAAIGYVAPALRQEWGLQSAQLVPAFGAGLVGLMIGSFVFGPLADRVGRRKVMLLSVLVFGIGALVSAHAPDIWTLILLRLFTGLGLGGAMPVCLTLSAEYSPARYRMILVTMSWMGFTAGLAAGGEVAATIIPTHGWRTLFTIGGLVPLVLLPFLYRWLPESISYLAMRPGSEQRLRATLAKITRANDWQTMTFMPPGPESRQKSPISQLFTGQFSIATPLLWVTFFCSLYVFYLLTNWLPTILKDAGLPIAAASRINAMMPLGGTIGSVVLALIMGRTNPCVVLWISYLSASALLAAAGFMLGHATWVMLFVFLAGFLWIGGQNGINLLATSIYPTTVRATGVGWALAAGRVGAITGSISGSSVLSFAGSTQSFFAAVAAPLAIAAFAQLLLHLFYGKILVSQRTDTAAAAVVP